MEKKFGSILDLDEDTVTLIGKDGNKYNMKLNLFQTVFEELPEDKRSKLLEETLFHSINTLMDFVNFYDEMKGNDGLLRKEFNVLLNGEPIIFVVTTGLLNYWTIISEVIEDDELTYIEKIEKLDLIKLNLLQAKLVAGAKFGGNETEITKNYPVIEQLIENQKVIFEMLANSDEKSVVSEIFRQKYEYIVENIFDNEKIIQVLNEIGYEREDNFKDFMIKEFNKRNVNEWMKYYERIDKASQHKTLKDHHLPVEDHIRNQNKIINADYETSDIGRETKANLEKFALKYIGVTDVNKQLKIKLNKSGSISKEKKSVNLFFDRDQIFNELEKLELGKRLPFISATIKAIDQFFVGKEFFDLPIHIRVLKKQLEGQQLIYKNLENGNMDVQQKEELLLEKKDLLDQDSVIEKFKAECVKRNLQKDKTIPLKQLYEIAKAIGFNVPEIEHFKAREKNYQEAREYASRLGYKRKKIKEPPLEE